MAKGTLEFSCVYAEFHPKILRYLSRMLGRDEAEDLAQEVFVKVDQALADFREEARFSTWIYRIATNAALDRLRSASFRQQQREESAEQTVETAAQNEPADRNVWTGEEKPATDQLLIRREMNRCIREYIDQLPEAYRVTLLLSEVEGFKNREIAEILELSLDTVKIRLHRARAKLKEKLGEHCTFYLNEQSDLSCDRKPPGQS